MPNPRGLIVCATWSVWAVRLRGCSPTSGVQRRVRRCVCVGCKHGTAPTLGVPRAHIIVGGSHAAGTDNAADTRWAAKWWLCLSITLRRPIARAVVLARGDEVADLAALAPQRPPLCDVDAVDI